MPLTGNPKHDIPTEIRAGKPQKQAVAIALNEKRAKHGKDDLEPVGAEDPQRALALAKHNAGVTKSQDKGAKGSTDEGLAPVGAEDGDLNAELDAARMAKEKLKHKLERGGLSEVGQSRLTLMLAKLTARVIALEQQTMKTNEVQPVGDVTELPMPIKTSNLVPMPSGEHNEERYAPRPVGDAGSYEAAKAEKNKLNEVVNRLSKALNAIEGVGAGAYGMTPTHVRATPEFKRAKQEYDTAWAKLRAFNTDFVKRYKKEYAAERVARRSATDRKRATDSIVEQVSGSEPKDHMSRAAQYEIQGDRARALDSYRAAASGYRKANDRANESVARDGITACQSKFAQQYDHPSAGRVKVCDSVESATRTAVERTRAGEDVRVDGKTVRPGRATDATLPKKDPAAYKALKQAVNKHDKDVEDDTGGPPPVDEPAYPGMPDPVRTDDEHLGFKKLEGKLAHEKGVTDPAAVAASIGREIRAEGMAKKAAAGRAKDAKQYFEIKFTDHRGRPNSRVWFGESVTAAKEFTERANGLGGKFISAKPVNDGKEVQPV